MRSTKALQVGPDVILQVSERQRNADGSFSIDNDLIRVENVTIVPDVNDGRKLVPARRPDPTVWNPSPPRTQADNTSFLSPPPNTVAFSPTAKP